MIMSTKDNSCPPSVSMNPGYPNEIVGIGILGLTKRRNKYILVMTGHLIKWCLVVLVIL